MGKAVMSNKLTTTNWTTFRVRVATDFYVLWESSYSVVTNWSSGLCRVVSAAGQVCTRSRWRRLRSWRKRRSWLRRRRAATARWWPVDITTSRSGGPRASSCWEPRRRATVPPLVSWCTAYCMRLTWRQHSATVTWPATPPPAASSLPWSPWLLPAADDVSADSCPLWQTSTIANLGNLG